MIYINLNHFFYFLKSKKIEKINENENLKTYQKDHP